MTKCFPLAQGRRMRVTRLDACGRPLLSDPCASVTSSGFVSVAASSDVSDGTAIEPLNANGELCYQIRSVDQFLRHTLEIEFCDVDPDLMGIVTHTESVEDFDAETVGFRTLEGGAVNGYALEIWAGVPGEECPDDPNVDESLGYFLFPWVMPGALGDFTIANDAINLMVGGFTRSGSGWDVGPYDVVPTDNSFTPGPLLTPIGPQVHMHMQYTTVGAPDAVCGCSSLS